MLEFEKIGDEKTQILFAFNEIFTRHKNKAPLNLIEKGFVYSLKSSQERRLVCFMKGERIMKDFIGVKQKIQVLSATVGLPVYYASDLKIYYEALEEYEGERFLLILRTSGAQLALLDNQNEEYRTRKLEEFKFYYAQCRDAQFYYFDGRKIAAIEPLTALKKIAAKKTDFGMLTTKMTVGLKNASKNVMLEV